MSSPATITVYNVTGQKLKILRTDPNQLDVKYNISDLKEGIYFVHFATVDFSKTIKLVVKK